MPGRTIAIGDVHGCAKALDVVLRAIAPTSDDTIVFVGDYVDRGPDSRGVIDSILRLDTECRVIPLMGNHEIMMLSALDGPDHVDLWLRCGGATTIASYGDRWTDFPDEHWRFLRGCRRFYETDTHLFYHANYIAELPSDQQPDGISFWHHLTMRAPSPHCSGKTVIVGHTPQPDGKVLDLGHLLCIDTYCFGGGWLTAMDVDTRQLWQADRLGKRRPQARN